MPVLEAMTELADLYLHPGIERFEYSDSNSKVQYIGALHPASPMLPGGFSPKSLEIGSSDLS